MMALLGVTRVGVSADPPAVRLLPCGVRAAVQPEPGTGRVAICVVARAPEWTDYAPTGAGEVMVRAAFGSNANQTRESVARALAETGGALRVEWSEGYAAIHALCVPASFADMMRTVGRAVKSAEFDDDAVSAALREVLAKMQAGSGDCQVQGYRGIRADLGVGRAPSSPAAERARLTRWTREQFVEMYRATFTTARVSVAVVGDVSVDRAIGSLENNLVDFERRESAVRVRLPLPEPPIGNLVADGASAALLRGCLGPVASDADYPAFAVAVAVLGRGKGSRLYQATREREGIGYSIDAAAPMLGRGGHMAAEVQCAGGDPGRRAKAAAALGGVFRSLQAEPPTAAECERARAFVVGDYLRSRERMGDRAFRLAWSEAVGPGYSFDAEYPDLVRKVSDAEVAAAARKYLARSVAFECGPAATP